MRSSPEIDKISEALSLAQADFKPLHRNKINPHFKSMFADHAASVEATRDALTKHGLAIVQGGHIAEGRLVVPTRLVHKSGQWLEDEISIKPIQDTAQHIGSAMTYARRYGRNAMLDLAADDDDDGELATKATEVSAVKKASPVPAKQPSMFELFAAMGIREPDLEAFIGLVKEKWSSIDKQRLRDVYADLLSGKMDKDDFMTIAYGIK